MNYVANVDLAFITYNRLEYTRLALASVLADPAEEFSLTIWDNASTDGTAEYLKREVSDPRINDIVFSRENVGQVAAVNQIWARSKADLLGKLDNDCLVTPGWTKVLSKAHEDISDLGVIACWHFPEEDFDYENAKFKIQRFGAHQVFRHPWTCGTGLLLKRDAFEQYGPIEGSGTTQFWLRMALGGLINGFYYPFVLQEHMDDPRSAYCQIKDDETLLKMKDVTYVLSRHNISNMSERWRRREVVLDNLNYDSWEAKNYVGWRKKVRAVKSRVSDLHWRTRNWWKSRQKKK